MSSVKVGEVQVGTVVFSRAAVTAVDVGTPAQLGGVTVASLDASGLLSYWPNHVSEITLADGVTLRGIRAVHENGDPYVAADQPDQLLPMVMIRAEDGGSITVAHDDVTIADAAERTTTAFGLATTIGPDAVQVFWGATPAGRRWRCPHWGIYVAGNPGNWEGSPPTTVSQAIDRLAAAVDSLIMVGGVP